MAGGDRAARARCRGPAGPARRSPRDAGGQRVLPRRGSEAESLGGEGCVVGVGGCAWLWAAGQRLRRNSLPATFSGVPVGRVGTGTLEAAELSGKCRSRCCGAAPGVRRRWEPRLGGSRVAWGLLLLSERSEKREARQEDGTVEFSGRLWRQVSQSIPSLLPGSPFTPRLAGRRGSWQVCGRSVFCSAPCTAPAAPGLRTPAEPVRKERGSQVPPRVCSPLGVLFSLGSVSLQLWSDFLSPSFKNLVLGILSHFILYCLKAVFFF